MKFQVTMKTPDGLDDAIFECTRNLTPGTIIDNELEIKKLCGKWFRYGECVTLEIDTEEKTCVVVEN